MGETTSAAPPAISRSTLPRQHHTQRSQLLQRDIHLIKIKYCEDTRPQNHLSVKRTAQELCTILQGASSTLHTISLGVGGTITTLHNEASRGSGSWFSQRYGFASKLHVHSVKITLPNLSISDVPFPAPFINSHRETVSGQACNFSRRGTPGKSQNMLPFA